MSQTDTIQTRLMQTDMMQRKCLWCGAPLTGRPDAMFCCRYHKERARAQVRREAQRRGVETKP